jgi:polyhydroxybutyrate depolymerase
VTAEALSLDDAPPADGSAPLDTAPPRRLGRRSAAALLAVLAVLAVGVPVALSSSPGAPAAASDELPPPLPVDAAQDPVVPPLPVPETPPVEPVRIAGPGTPAGDSRIVDVQVGAESRAYFLLPALNLPKGEPASLLVVLHQDVGSAREMSVGLGLDDLRKQGITLAYPSGVGGSWNAGGCCGIALAQGVDDVGFVNAVLDDVGRHTPIDPDSRALLGYSGGGMLAYRVLCGEHPPLVAAVEVNGSLEHRCAGQLELPDLLAVHGEKDGSIDLVESHYVNHLRMSPRSVTATLETITAHAGCGPQVRTTTNGIGVWTSRECRGRSVVQAHIVPEAGHGWADVGGAARASVFLLPRLAKR